MDSQGQAVDHQEGRSDLEETVPYYKVLLVFSEVSILIPC